MQFSKKQVEEILNILKRSQLVLVANTCGPNYLTKREQNILMDHGIKITPSVIENSFMFGLLAAGLANSEKMTYTEFRRYLSSKKYMPLTDVERHALTFVKDRAYTDITNLHNRMQNSVQNMILQQHDMHQSNFIQGEAITAIQERRSIGEFASNLARITEDWSTDWQRIAHYIIQQSFNQGRCQDILRTYGPDAQVYYDVYKDACKWCKRLYLDGDDVPKIFKLSDVIANGSNIGRKPQEWMPSISPIHPYCRCTVNYLPPNHIYDRTKKEFIPRDSILRDLIDITID